MHALSVLAADDGGGGGGVLQLLILLLIPFAMYFLLIRPQRRRAKSQAAVQAALGKGDEVITTSGIYGFISAVEDDYFWLEIDDDVQIRIAKAAVQGRVPGTEPAGVDTAPATPATNGNKAVGKAADKPVDKTNDKPAGKSAGKAQASDKS